MFGRERRLVFFSYYHGDERWLQKLTVHLQPLSRGKGIPFWIDNTSIRTGQTWSGEIAAALESAKIAVVLVTPEYLDRDYVIKHELPAILKAAKQKKLCLVWIPVERTLPEARGALDDFQSAVTRMTPLSTLDPVECDKQIVEIARFVWQTALDQIPPKEPEQPWISRSAVKRGAAVAALAALSSILTYDGIANAYDPGLPILGWLLLWGCWAAVIGLGWFGGSALLGRIRKAGRSVPLAALALLAFAAGSASAQPQAVYFDANPSTIAAGEAVALSWRVPPGYTAFIDGLGWVPLIGTAPSFPVVSGRYHLTICDSQYRAVQNVYASVTVLPPRPSIAPTIPGTGSGPGGRGTGPIGGGWHGRQGAPPPLPAGYADLVARKILVGNQPEPEHYGLYSYLLLSRRASRSLALSVLGAVAEQIDLAQPFLDQGDDPHRLNLLLVPLTVDLPENSPPDQLLANYNFYRAQSLLAKIPDAGPGPYLITVEKPIPMNGSMPAVYVLQDMSGTTPEMAASMVENFRRTALLKAAGRSTRLLEQAEDFRLWLARHDTLPAGMRPVLALFEPGQATTLHR